ncbi:class I SAM-dependent methyltransferase [Luedemannella flava]
MRSGRVDRRARGAAGRGSVSAVDPSEPFVAAVRERLPGVDARHGVAEELPWPDDAFDRAAAQLVVHFMADPVAGLAEMARVTRPGGTVAATVWDFVGGTAPLTVFWRAALSVDPDAPGEARLAGTGPGQLDELLGRAGLVDVTSTMLTISVDFASFEQWWEPFTLGVGPAGAYLAAQPDDRRDTIRDACARLLPAGSFTLSAGPGRRGDRFYDRRMLGLFRRPPAPDQDFAQADLELRRARDRALSGDWLAARELLAATGRDWELRGRRLAALGDAAEDSPAG